MKANCFELFAFAHDVLSFANKFATYSSQKAPGEEQKATGTVSSNALRPAIRKLGDLAHLTALVGIRRRRRVAVQ
jgi:hypothetical protein